MPIFIVFFENNQKIAQKIAQKNDNFSHFAKHRFIKNPLCCNPPFFEKMCFFNLHSLKPNTDVEQKTKLKIRKKQR